MHLQKIKEKIALKEQFMKLKPRTVQLESVHGIPIEGRQMLRDVITEYIIRNMPISDENYQKKKLFPTAMTMKKTNYEPIQVVLEINGKTQTILFDITEFLDRYLIFEKKNIYRHYHLEPLIIDILNFLDGMDEMSKEMGIEIEEDSKKNQKVLNMLIQKYHKDKQRNALIFDYDEIKRKTIGKYKKVSFIEFDKNFQKKECEFLVEKSVDSNSQRISRTTITPLQKQQYKQSNLKLMNKSKLKQLVDSCNIFKHPQKIEQLRKQKLIEQYCRSEADFIEMKQSCKENPVSPSIANQSHSMQSLECLKFLEQWVSDLNLSQKLYQKKLQSKNDQTKKQVKKQEDSSSQSEDDSIDF